MTDPDPMALDDGALRALVLGFWRARGADPQPLRAGLYLSRGADGLEGLVLPSDAGASDALAADWLLASIRELRAAGAQGSVPIVTRTSRGLNNADRAAISAADGQILFPLAFFDTDFRGEGAARDALREAILEERIDLRAPQPFKRLTRIDDASAPVQDGDLFELLNAEFARFPSGPSLTVLSGPAGVGKTALVSELALTLHDRFNDAKRRNALATRPLMFLPYGLGARAEETVEDLIEATMRSAFLQSTAPGSVKWLNENGFSLWIFDGLDEFFRRQSGFFETLEALLSAPGGRSRILLCTRDSLMSSAPALIDFLGRRLARAPETTRLYELARWSPAAKGRYVAARLGDARAAQVIARLQSDPVLASLSDLPFYARLIVDAVSRGDEAALVDEFTLLDHTLDALIDRESAKLKIDWDVFVSGPDAERIIAERGKQSAMGLAPDGENYLETVLQEHGRATLKLLLGSAAHFYRFAAVESDGDVSIDELGEVLTPIYLSADLDETAEGRLKLALVQFPLFGRGDASGVAFTHDLIADYLAGVFAWDWISRQDGATAAMRYALGRRSDIGATAFLRYLRTRFSEDPDMGAALRKAAEAGDLPGASGEVAEQILRG